MFPKRFRKRVLVAAIAAVMPVAAFAADDVTTLKQQVEQLRKEVSELRSLIQQQRQQAATKEEVQKVQQEAATKQDVQQVQQQVTQVKSEAATGGLLGQNSIVHLGGYGAIGYTDRTSGSRGFSQVSFAPIFHYQYKDKLFFETELHIARQPDGGTDVALEYANLNWLLNNNVVLFGGQFLTPVGYFVQNLHPAWINLFPSMPPGWGDEGAAAPEANIGVGARGGFKWGNQRANYAVFVGNSPHLELNAAGDEIEAIEGEAFTSNPSKRPTFAGRVGFLPIPQLELGLSGGVGKVTIDNGGMIEPDRSYTVAGGDFGFKAKGLDFRGEYIQQRVGNQDQSVAPQGGTWKAWYLQAAYRIPGTGWEPVVRYGKHTTPHLDQGLRQWGIGIDYWLTASAVGKLAYEFNSGEAGTPNNDNRLLVQFAYGF